MVASRDAMQLTNLKLDRFDFGWASNIPVKPQTTTWFMVLMQVVIDSVNFQIELVGIRYSGFHIRSTTNYLIDMDSMIRRRPTITIGWKPTIIYAQAHTTICCKVHPLCYSDANRVTIKPNIYKIQLRMIQKIEGQNSYQHITWALTGRNWKNVDPE